jgi:hypothetical protein
MRRFVRCGGLILLLVAFIVPTFAGGAFQKEVGEPTKKDGDDPKDKKDKKKAEIKEKFSYGVKFMGKVTAVDTNGTNRDFTLQVSNKVQEIDTGVQQQLLQQQQQLANHQREYLQARTVQGKQQAQQRMQQSQNQIAQTMQRLYKVKDVTKDFKFRPAENVIYRTLYAEPEYDDKGDLKKLTKEDLDRLKGKHKDLPGYEATADILRVNANAAVYTPKAKVQPKELKKKTDDDDPVVTDRQEVILVIIVNTPPVPNK